MRLLLPGIAGIGFEAGASALATNPLTKFLGAFWAIILTGILLNVIAVSLLTKKKSSS